jgi:replicative DNA helicase
MNPMPTHQLGRIEFVPYDKFPTGTSPAPSALELARLYDRAAEQVALLVYALRLSTPRNQLALDAREAAHEPHPRRHHQRLRIDAAHKRRDHLEQALHRLIDAAHQPSTVIYDSRGTLHRPRASPQRPKISNLKSPILMNPDPNAIPLWSQPTEAGLISSVLNGGTTALDAAMELVHDDWFFAPVNATAWQVLKTLSAKRQPIDLLTFTEGFRQTGELDKIEGGPGFITHEYTRTECSAATVSHWADQLRDYWRRREIHRIGVELMFEARNFQRTSDEILDTSEKSLLDLRLDTKQTGLQHCATAVSEAADRIEQAYKKRGKPIGIATGFHDFDRMTSGLKPSQLIIIAARPSMGKSAFATNIAEHACLADKVPTALFSLEMGAADLMERVLCTQAGVKLQRIRDGFMSKTDMQNLGSKHAEISQAPLYIDETPALSIAAFRARARRAVAKYGVKLLIVDYLQLMKGSSKRAAQDRRLEIDEISSGLKQTAMELAVPVIALSQLNRDAEERAEPKLSHLRESGSIEQDADVVALLHRRERSHAQGRRQGQSRPDPGQATQRPGRPDRTPLRRRDHQIQKQH